jgi:hypothetical protein
VKHWFTVPHPASDMPDVTEWARSHGWRVIEYTWETSRFGLLRDHPLALTVTLVPMHGLFPDDTVQIRASSGATLIYDDTDRSMAVTLEPEPRDAVPVEPHDAIPAGG